MKKVNTPQEAKLNPEYQSALRELLYQLADDDFLHAFRGSEWLGLAPHIEEDVAFSSINQDTMGHAAMYYSLLEELGEGSADDLAHLRDAGDRKNAVLLELVNGSGTYLDEPRYDWAFTVVRHYFYDTYKKLKLESLKLSSYQPLADAAVKINMEQYYHVMHWKVWFQQLSMSKGEGRERMLEAISRVWKDFGGVLSYGPLAAELHRHGLVEEEQAFKKRWESAMKRILEQVEVTWPGEPGMELGDGRSGIHTADLSTALETLSEVCRSYPKAVW
ncbi:1,2-phenylacetyl-CoA epoxidase subunit PaaC [Falsibacillus pallidus]|uniref:1,2-phenylacetyl-CoA epoxidase subunit PaaC n=1 Tax=Falsibacillus pallidus TaxID=493781 RepID=UPI003D99164F